MFWKKIQTKEYLELKKDLEALRIRFEGLQLDFDLIRKKLRVKRKLDEEEPESKDLKETVLLPEI